MRNEALHGLALGLLDKGYARKEVKEYLLKHKFSPQEIEQALKELDQKNKRHQLLVSFVKKQKQKGHSYESIRHHMLKHGITHEETHRAIGHVISSKSESPTYFLMAVASIILALIFIFPFLPPIGLILSVIVLFKSSEKRTKTIATIGLILCILSLILIGFLFVTRGTRTGLATAALSDVHNSVELFPGDTKQITLFLINDNLNEITFQVQEQTCTPDCPQLSIDFPQKGTIPADSYFSFPVIIRSTTSSEGKYVIHFSIQKGEKLVLSDILLTFLASPKNNN